MNLFASPQIVNVHFVKDLCKHGAANKIGFLYVFRFKVRHSVHYHTIQINQPTEGVQNWYSKMAASAIVTPLPLRDCYISVIFSPRK
jgi:hypothetical protein